MKEVILDIILFKYYLFVVKQKVYKLDKIVYGTNERGRNEKSG